MKFDINTIKDDFPILFDNNKDLVYLDSAATSQKPKSVINAIKNYYETSNGNPHRGAHYLGILATQIYDDAKEKTKSFINAKQQEEIIFTKSATESLNLLAYSYGMNFIEEGDEIVISILEHHSNLIPWQQVAKAKKATLKYLYIDKDGNIPQSEIEEKITEKTKILSLTHVSNALGVINPVKSIISYAHKFNTKVILDITQSVAHMKVDVMDLDCDIAVFSGHKMLGPMGIGVLYGKKELLDIMPPFLFGGDMIEYVYEDSATFAEVPYKFEAGTQNVEGAIGLTKAMEYLEKIGLDNIHSYEKELTQYAINELSKISFIEIYGPLDIDKRAGVISFNVDEVHPHDVATILDSQGIAVRAGHHCCQPLMRYLKLNATCRASFYFYNTKEDVDKLVKGLIEVRKVMGYES
ncbi:cysteine desulfurase [Romboutsia sp.]|uniref:cysteine desulfurase n=1 Tax=Romboutsia sp. TaxID=1965302 RepID=UPI003F364782